MSYYLTLTREERKAIDWIGNRYSHGDELYRRLWSMPGVTAEPNDADWDDDRDIKFHIPEHVAWKIKELLEEDGMTCFSDALMTKFYNFMDKIV